MQTRAQSRPVHRDFIVGGGLPTQSGHRRRLLMRLRATLWAAALLLLPATIFAQDATVIGTVKDTTDAVLPGVTVTALKIDNGNTFVDVTDGAGNYRL